MLLCGSMSPYTYMYSLDRTLLVYVRTISYSMTKRYLANEKHL